MKKHTKIVVSVILSAIMILGVMLPVLASPSDRGREPVGDVQVIEDGRLPGLTIEIMPEADLLLVDVEALAVYHMYTIMEYMTGNDMPTTHNRVHPFLSGFSIESVIPTTDSTNTITAFAVNFISNCGATAYVVVGTAADMPPLIEFSLCGSYDGVGIIPMWIRACQIELAKFEAAERLAMEAAGEFEAFEFDWDRFGLTPPETEQNNLQDNLHTSTHLLPTPTPMPELPISDVVFDECDWAGAWVETLTGMEGFNAAGFMSSPINHLSADTVAEIQGAIEINPLWINVPHFNLPRYRSIRDLQYRHAELPPRRLHHICAAAAVFNLMIYYELTNRSPGLVSRIIPAPNFSFELNERVLMSFLYSNLRINRYGPGTNHVRLAQGIETTLRNHPQVWPNTFSAQSLLNRTWDNFTSIINRNYPTLLMFYRDTWYYDFPTVPYRWSNQTVLAIGYRRALTVNYIRAIDGWRYTWAWCAWRQESLYITREVIRSVSRGNNPPADRLIHVNVGWMLR